MLEAGVDWSEPAAALSLVAEVANKNTLPRVVSEDVILEDYKQQLEGARSFHWS